MNYITFCVVSSPQIAQPVFVLYLMVSQSGQFHNHAIQSSHEKYNGNKDIQNASIVFNSIQFNKLYLEMVT